MCLIQVSALFLLKQSLKAQISDTPRFAGGTWELVAVLAFAVLSSSSEHVLLL